MPPQTLESRLEAVSELAQARGFSLSYDLDRAGKMVRFYHSKGTGLAIPFHQVMNLSTVALLRRIQQAVGLTVNEEFTAMPRKPLAGEISGIDFKLLYLQEAGFSRYEASHLRLLLWDVETGRLDPEGLESEADEPVTASYVTGYT